jgi:hypothetical protein
MTGTGILFVATAAGPKQKQLSDSKSFAGARRKLRKSTEKAFLGRALPGRGLLFSKLPGSEEKNNPPFRTFEPSSAGSVGRKRKNTHLPELPGHFGLGAPCSTFERFWMRPNVLDPASWSARPGFKQQQEQLEVMHKCRKECGANE